MTGEAQSPRLLERVREVKAILSNLEEIHHLIASLLYGSGLRLSECLQLRVKDIDFECQQITVRDGKGQKDRVTMLPKSAIEPLKLQLEQAKRLHQQDLVG
jgi:integrase